MMTADTKARGPTRVMLVDDHEVVRAGLHALIERHDDLVVVGEAATTRDAINRVGACAPDVVVLDVKLPDGSGVQACRAIKSRYPDVAVLMLTSFSDDRALFDAIMAGAAGYVLKRIRGDDLIMGIRRVATGQSLLDPAVTARVLDRIRRPPTASDDKLAQLTPTEVRIVEMIAQGLTNRAIGLELGLAEKTIKNYVSCILSKMSMARRSEAAAYLAAYRASARSG